VRPILFRNGNLTLPWTANSVHPLKSNIAVLPILADVVKVKKGSESTAHWSIDFIRLNGWLRRCFTLLITPLDIDGIGQNWEDSNSALVLDSADAS